MTFEPITKENRESLEALMLAYYQEGEDAETPVETIKDFIAYLFQKLCDGEIAGVMVKNDGPYEGFCLWMKDEAHSEFSEVPGYGTILEIGVKPEARKKGIGREIVRHAEAQMRKQGAASFYVSAYGPSEAFWERCSYYRSERTAKNGLPIFVK
ncbi:MAG: GNAT family N-acetyltransferase [Oscillospiraceae bacterium]|nr:GNAT family N-acetyltransferase [Oscillospiraceae bacterium]